jgi:excisionase family DNA binding protein
MSGSNEIPDRYLKPREAAAYLGLAEGTVRNKASRGELPFSKVGHALRFRVSELDAWVRENTPGKAAA